MFGGSFKERLKAPGLSVELAAQRCSHRDIGGEPLQWDLEEKTTIIGGGGRLAGCDTKGKKEKGESNAMTFCWRSRDNGREGWGKDVKIKRCPVENREKKQKAERGCQEFFLKSVDPVRAPHAN